MMNTLITARRLPSLALGFGLLAAAPAAVFAQAVPIAGTGYNVDGIVEAGSTNSATSTTHLADITQGLDGQFAYFERGYGGTMAPNGLVIGNFVSATGSGTTFTLQPAIGNNVLEVENEPAGGGGTPTATFTLTTPAEYSSIAFLETGFNGDQAFSFTLNYTTGASTTGTGTAFDNFANSGTQSQVALDAAGRVLVGQGIDTNQTNPSIYETDFTGIDPTRILSSITLNATGTDTGQGTGAHATAFFGFSGTPVAVPEPSTWAMLLLGGAGLTGYVRSRRAARA